MEDTWDLKWDLAYVRITDDIAQNRNFDFWRSRIRLQTLGRVPVLVQSLAPRHWSITLQHLACILFLTGALERARWFDVVLSDETCSQCAAGICRLGCCWTSVLNDHYWLWLFGTCYCSRTQVQMLIKNLGVEQTFLQNQWIILAHTILKVSPYYFSMVILAHNVDL